MRTAGGKRRVAGGGRRTRCDELSEVVQARSAATRGETRALFGEVERQSEDTGGKSRAEFQEEESPT